MNMLMNMNVEIIIADSMTAQFVDVCKGVENGDLFFARHPYKMFVLFEGKGDRSRFFVEMQYKKTVDLNSFKNKQKCQRSQNAEGRLTDPNTGSTIGGTNGFGYPITPVDNQGGNNGGD